MAKQEEAAAESKPKRSKKKLILFAGLGIVLLAGGVGVALMIVGGKDKSEEGDQVADVSTAEEIAGDAGGSGGARQDARNNKLAAINDDPGSVNYVFEEPFQVNLMDAGGNKILQLQLHLEASRPEVVERIKRKVPPLRDAIIMLLSGKTVEEVSRVKGMMRLKQEIILRLEGVLDAGSIKSVYFTDYLVLGV